MTRPPDERLEGLRQEAEARVRALERTLDRLLPADLTRTLHELRVHEVELELQQAELREALARADALRIKYLDLFDTTPAGYLTLDEGGTIEDANLAAAELLGVERSRLRGRRFPMFIAAHDRPAVRDLLAAALDGHVQQECDVRPDSARQTGRYLRVSALAIPGTGRCRILMTDVTDRRRAEDAQQVQESVLDAAVDAIFITNADGTIAWANQAFRRVTGYDAPTELGPAGWRMLRPVLAGDGDAPALERALEIGLAWRGTIESRRRDGTAHVEEWTVTPVRNREGQFTQCITVARDLEQQRALEAQLRQAQKMETVGRLAGGIAHDFNNLLTVINGAAAEAHRHLASADLVRQNLEEIEAAGTRAASLTRQLLAYSRQQHLTEETFVLAAMVADLRGLLARLIGEHIVLQLEAPSPAGAVHADRSQVEQVLMNLVVNARDAMPGGGTITIVTRSIELDRETAGQMPGVRPGPFVQLCVSDTGTGMTEEVRARLFEPFFTTKEQGKGTGLGLSTVLGIVTQSGGGVRVESAPGAGTTMHVYLPRVAAGPGEPAAASAGSPSTGHETILLVEDEAALRRLTARVLARQGYRVITAEDGTEALAALAAHEGEIHLLFSDVVMPGMSGVELAREVLRRRPATRVLLTSGYAGPPPIADGAPEAGPPFLPKPYTIDEVAARVREVLDAARDAGPDGAPA